MAGKTDDIEEVDDSGHYGRHNAGILLRGYEVRFLKMTDRCRRHFGIWILIGFIIEREEVLYKNSHLLKFLITKVFPALAGKWHRFSYTDHQSKSCRHTGMAVPWNSMD